ncbi:MAG: zinc ribbon domain-containing protein, partial [Dehalococcoidia bacterium]|nr:zinc ribbon domain-containing protein [Dehalococcoidia bacterium]
MDDVVGPYIPRKTADADPYWEGARQNELRYQVCNGCQATVFHARSICPYCLSEDLRWTVSGGKGRIYSFTVLHRAPSPAYASKLPYALGIV